MSGVVIPWQSLSSDALDGVIEEFVTREGTEYGMREVSLESKVAEVRAQLRAGEVVIVYDAALETASIVPADSLAGESD